VYGAQAAWFEDVVEMQDNRPPTLPCTLTCDDHASDQALRHQLEKPDLLEGSAVPVFLRPYGFLASTAMNWSAQPPELSITVSGHSTSERHTFYNLDCSLASGNRTKEPLVWRAALRLNLMRGLHDLVKKQLGSSYQTYFCGVPFAHHGRPVGTTARLYTWCQRLAFCVNSKLVPPLVAAAVLRLTGVPHAPAPTDVGSRPSRQKVEKGSHVACRPLELDLNDDASAASGDSHAAASVCVSGSCSERSGGKAPHSGYPDIYPAASPTGTSTCTGDLPSDSEACDSGDEDSIDLGAAQVCVLAPPVRPCVA